MLKELAALLKKIALIVCLSCLSGCAYGIIYSDTVEPLVTNMQQTPFTEQLAVGHSQEFKEPFTLGGLKIQFASHAIGEAAKNSHFEKIFYADIRRISILGGLWKKNIVRVYGSGYTQW